jgi:hypothetical protein
MAGSTTRDFISGLSKPRRGKKQLAPKKKLQGTIIPTAGLGKSTGVSVAKATGGGISSPLTEQSLAARTYYSSTMLYSSDGLFSFYFTPIKSMKFIDADNRQVVFIFKQDPPPEE